MATPSLKLWYFNLPGRAETTRLLLTIGGIPFEDYQFPREEWPTIKPKMPFGQVPVLEVDGKMLAQSSAIEQYAAKLAGLYPSDPWEGAKVDEVVAFLQEIQDTIMPTMSIQDPEARIKARQEIVAGPLTVKLTKLTELLGDKPFLTGDKVTYADVLAFKNLSGLVGGAMDGIPTTLLDNFPKLKEHHNRVASLPAVAKKYEGVTEGMLLSYKPLP